MRPKRKIEIHNLNVRKNVYGRIRRRRVTPRQYEIKDISSVKNVGLEMIERYGIDAIKYEMIKELTQELINADLIKFDIQEGNNPDIRTIKAELNIVKNG